MAEDFSSRRHVCSFPMKFQFAIPIVILIFSVLFQIVAIATPYWYHRSVYRNGDYEIESNIGLWKVCSLSSTVCVDLHDAEENDPPFIGDQIITIRALELTGLIGLLLSLLLLAIYCTRTSGRIVVLVTGLIAISSGICIGIGNIILLSELEHYDFVDVSFGLSMATFGLSFIVFIAFLYIYRRIGLPELSESDRLAIYREKESYLTLNSRDRYVDTNSGEEFRDITGYRNPLHDLAAKSSSESSNFDEEISESEYSESSL